MSRAADDVAFDQGDLGAEPGGMRGRGVPRGPPADDDEACRHGEEATASGQPSVQPSPANIVPLWLGGARSVEVAVSTWLGQYLDG